MQLKLLFSLLFAFYFQLLQAQTIQGVVLNEQGEPLEKAHIYIKETGKTTVTDTDGEFSVTLDDNESDNVNLVVTSLGYEPANRMAETGEFIRITLKRAVYDSGTMVITATRTRRDIEDVSIPVVVVSTEEIERSGSTRLSDILLEQTGLNIISDHGTGLQMQGFDPDYTLIMIDDQPVIGRSAGTLNLDRLSVGDVKQIEIVKGPSSALWGSDALAGVINIITEKGNQPLSWDLSGQLGSHTSYDGSTNISVRREKIRGRFFANANGSGGYDLNKKTIAPTIPQYNSSTFSGGIDYKLSPVLSVGLNSRYYREGHSSLRDIEVDNSEARIQSKENQENYSITPEMSLRIGDRQVFDASAYLSRFNSSSESRFTESGEIYASGIFEQALNKYEIKSSTFWNKDHTSVFGVGMNHEELVSANYADVPAFQSYFVFGQHEWNMNEELSFTTGFRFDAHNEYASQWSPKFSGLYKPNEIIHIRASIGGGFKAPEFRQLYLDFTNAQAGYSVFGFNTVVEGVERLQNEGEIDELLIDPRTIGDINAEHSFAYNAGFDLFPFDGVQLRVNAYRNNVEDLIDTRRIAVKTNGQSVFSYFNLNKIYTQGIESELRFVLPNSEKVRISLGYQFLDARREITREVDKIVDGRVVTTVRKEYIPMFNRSRHTWNAKLFYTFERLGVDANLRFLYRGRYWFSDSNNNNQPDDGEYALDPNGIQNRTLLGSAESYMRKVIVNASLAKTFGERYRLQVGADNILNFQSPRFMPSNPGRTFYAQFKIQLY
ncbi:TonB-dependent receptor [Gracilimonas sp.]|uniref:TonB-dependent receptor n=1 Tax=Gracilimonas sp. TaxID=1974203 RepID=UPI003D0C69BB